MKLSNKIFIYLTGLLILLSVFSFSSYNYYISSILKNVEKIHIDYLSKDIRDTLSILDYEILYLNSLAVKLKNEKNLTKNKLKIYKVDFLVKNDKILSLKDIDISFVENIKNKLAKENNIYGITRYKGKYIFLSGKKFFTGTTVIVGRFLDKDFIKNLKKLTNIDISFSPPKIYKNSPFRTYNFKYLKNVKVYLKKDENNDEIYFFTIINGIDGNPLLQLTYKQKNLISTIGKRFISFTVASFIIFFSFFYGLLLFLLNKIVINPIERLTENVSKIAENEDLNIEVSERSVKELSKLSDAINWFTNSLKEYERKLIDEKLLFESLSVSAPIGIAIIEKENIIYKNPYFVKNIGDLNNLKNLLLRIPKDYHPFLKNALKLFEENKSILESIELKIKDVNNKEKDFTFILSPIDYEGKSSVLLIAVDLSEIREKEEKIEKALYEDPITGLPNRNAFVNKIKELILISSLENKKFAVMIVDIDNFKNINDTFGPALGDNLLKKIGGYLYEKLKNNKNVFISRLGGDEFGITLKYDTEKELKSFIEETRKLFENVFYIDGIPITLTISMGIAVFPDNGEDVFELLKHADSALYKAKKEGKNRYALFNIKIEEELREKLELERNIKEALENEEFYFLYQPIYDLKTESIVGAEALIRWNSKKLGFVPPSKFIPLAEESDLIVEIDNYVLEKNIEFVRELVKENINDINISLNFSAKFFKEGLIYEKLKEKITESEICKYIEIEITEREIMQDVEESLRILNLLKSMGFKLTIDDFGTGYSSLSYLKRLPIDLLKIDISFIRDIPDDMNDIIITRTIINMAHNLGLKTIAEGIEKIEQLFYLKDESCDYGQGYYFSKPIPKEDFLELLKKR